MNKNFHYKVVALGITNMGKSSLLSALANQNNLFPSGDVPRVTLKLQKENLGLIQFVDTPGLDADTKDTKIAMKEAETADTILWCHSLRFGEFREKEMNALKRYAESTHSIWRTCFVITHSDDVANWDVVKLISSRIAEQLWTQLNIKVFDYTKECVVEESVGSKPRPMNYIGIKTYWRALTFDGQRQEKLKYLSGVPILRKFLEELASKKYRKINVGG
jgi:predicted GTPase